MPIAPINAEAEPRKSQSGDTLITTNDIATANRDTFINRTAINTNIYTDIYGSLLSYTEGFPVTVEYFKKKHNYTNVQSIDTSFSGERSAVQFSFDLIHNFEIRLKEQLDQNIDTDATEIILNGSGIVYPGFKPNVGDIFYLKLLDNRIGAFVVNLTQPLSIAHGTHYAIEFHFDTFVNTTYDEKIRASVSEELYFDKSKYFSDPATLLKAESYQQLQSLLHYRKKLISNIFANYYNSSEKTIICPDNIFDTYLIEYLTNKISVLDYKKDICQIANPDIDKFEHTILHVLLDRDISNLTHIGYTLYVYKQFLFDVNISNLDLFRMISVLNDTSIDTTRYLAAKFDKNDSSYRTVNYIFSNRFYYILLKYFETGVLPEMNENDLLEMATDERFYENLSNQFYSVNDNSYHDISFFDTHMIITGSNNDIHLPELEYMILNFILNDTIDLNYLLNVLKLFPYVNMTKNDKLYYMSILLHLIDISANRLR